MGGAVSKNTAQAVSNIVNSVTIDTVGDISNAQITSNGILIKGTTIKLSKDLNVINVAKNIYTSKQLATQLQNSQIKNDISQKMLQEAMSTVGALGVGFASATNNASVFASASNQVKNSLSATVSNFASFDTTTTIINSDITARNINISNLSDSNYITDQTIKNDQISDIDNKISQDISQKASATVQGLTGVLLALALLIGVIAYSLTKPLNTSAVKIIISGALVIGIIILFIWLYTISAPPIFSEPIIVSQYIPFPQNGNCKFDVVDNKMRILKLKDPPLKYLYNIYIVDDKTLGCLLTLACSKAVDKTTPNLGYNLLAYDNLNKNKIDEKFSEIRNKFTPNLPNLPNLFQTNDNGVNDDKYYVDKGKIVDSFEKAIKITKDSPANIPLDQIVAFPNISGFKDYCKDPIQANYCRFVLCDYLGIPNYYFINDNDPIQSINDASKYDLAKNIDDKYKIKIIKYNSFLASDKMTGGSEISGYFGICNSNQYKITQNFKKWGFYIFILLIIGIILFIFLKKPKNKNTINNKIQQKNVRK